MDDEQIVRPLDIEPLIEASINCGVYFVVFLIAVVLDRFFPDWTAMTYALVILPYLIVLGFILFRGKTGHPWLTLGSAGEALVRLFLIWAILVLVAFIFAYLNGLLMPLSPVGRLNHVGTILGAPLAEEFVFRAALLSSLSRTQLGSMQIFKVPMSVIAGAVIYCVVQCVIFLAAGVDVADALVTGFVALMMGVGFGVIYVKTQNVWYGVFLHMLINFGRWS
jgi:membrane protease YdiL (CAAX protease family)